jgi:hypothetical protein
MNNHLLCRSLASLALACFAASSSAQAPSEGLTLFQPLTSATTYLVDLAGNVFHSWQGTAAPGNSVYLLDNNQLLRTIKLQGTVGGSGGGIQRVAWDGTLLWDFQYLGSAHLHHHDVAMLPNGNVLLIAWEYLTSAQAIAAGRNPAYLVGPSFAPDHIVEVQPNGPTGGTIVWEWHLWDHLIQDFDASKLNFGVVADHPELVDLNYPPQTVQQGDWNHVNSIDYNATLDQILLSSHNQNEIWVIDHSTTTAEAAGHTGGNSGRGGDILYRWGNPQAYRAGVAADQKLFGQHNAQWIDANSPGGGNILLFNNGLNRPQGAYSSIEEFAPPMDAQGNYTLTPGSAYGPVQVAWNYTAAVPTSFYSSNISGAQRLPNGNTLICEGTSGRFFEVTSAGQTVWQYQNPFPLGAGSKRTFRCTRYRPCLVPESYCVAAPNSVGPGALMGWSGSVSHSANDFVLAISGAPNLKAGLFLFGAAATQTPFANGFLCVSPPVRRLPGVQTTGIGTASYALDFTNPGLSSNVIAPGQTWRFQFWHRDPSMPPAGSNLSNGLAVTFCD